MTSGKNPGEYSIKRNLISQLDPIGKPAPTEKCQQKYHRSMNHDSMIHTQNHDNVTVNSTPASDRSKLTTRAGYWRTGMQKRVASEGRVNSILRTGAGRLILSFRVV